MSRTYTVTEYTNQDIKELEKFRRRILVTSVVSKTPQMPEIGIPPP